MNIYWLGQSSYLIETDNKKKILIDPFNNEIGYTPFKGAVDLVTISHEHFDHNFLDLIENNPTVIRTVTTHDSDFYRIEGIGSFHDDNDGSEKGENIIFKYNIDGITLCHLGDLGHELNEETLEQIGKVDILFVPVGEVYTFNVESAVNVVKAISPKYIVPMHFKTELLNIPLEKVDKFLLAMKDYPNESVPYISINKSNIKDENKILVMDIHCK